MSPAGAGTAMYGGDSIRWYVWLYLVFVILPFGLVSAVVAGWGMWAMAWCACLFVGIDAPDPAALLP